MGKAQASPCKNRMPCFQEFHENSATNECRGPDFVEGAENFDIEKGWISVRFGKNNPVIHIWPEKTLWNPIHQRSSEIEHLLSVEF